MKDDNNKNNLHININKGIKTLLNTPGLPIKTKQQIKKIAGDIKTLQKSEKLSTTLSNIDGLTELFNHRYFHKTLERELSLAERFKHSLSLVMIDIDHFKKFNDTYGHPQGDIVLKELAQVIKNEIRSYDIASRYGGEEFSVIMPYTDRRDAFFLAERIRKKISIYPFPGLRKKTGDTIQITISAGVAAFPANAYTKSLLINRADKSLYMAKEEGRNRVCSCSITGKDFIKFAFCPPSLSPFFVDVLRGIRDVAEEIGNVELLIFDSKSDSAHSKQLQLMKKAVNKDIDAIAICSKINVGDVIAKANKSNIKAFVFNVRRLIMSPSGKITSFVGYEQEEAGKKVGEYLVKILRKKGRIAIIEGIRNEIDSQLRKKGFCDVIKNYESMSVVESETANWERNTAKNIAIRMLKKHREIDAFFCLSDEMALGAVDAVKEEGLAGKIFTIGLDGNQNALQSIKNGELTATLNTNPVKMGRILMRIVIRSTIKEEIIPEKTDSPINIVSFENVDQFL